jgi:hypothetical protein
VVLWLLKIGAQGLSLALQAEDIGLSLLRNAEKACLYTHEATDEYDGALEEAKDFAKAFRQKARESGDSLEARVRLRVRAIETSDTYSEPDAEYDLDAQRLRIQDFVRAAQA